MPTYQHEKLAISPKNNLYFVTPFLSGIIMKKILSTLMAVSSLLISTLTIAQTVEVNNESFKCLTEMTPVRGFFVDNLLGDLTGTLKAANAEKDMIYPVGSVVQLVPTEVMIKREAGFNSVTKDWEFFELKVSEAGSKIHVRGAFEVVNKFGGNCFGCHIKAKPEFDLICEQTHGCDPITLPNGMVLSQEMIKGAQKLDPRCAASDALQPQKIQTGASQ
jgi:hypothetical protein